MLIFSSKITELLIANFLIKGQFYFNLGKQFYVNVEF